jgi:AcrR family transcriptional regulator
MPAQAPQRTRLDPDERREQLLEVAIASFGSRPYGEVTIADIAQRAGVSKGLVFNYFDGKRQLFREVLRVAAARADLASDPDPALPAGERFRIGLERFVAIVAERPHLLPAVAADPEVRATVDAAYQSVADRMIERMGVTPTPRLRHAVLGWLEFVRATTAGWVADPALTRDELIELQIATFRAAATSALGADAARAALP